MNYRGGRLASQTDGRDSDESSGKRRSERFSNSFERVNYTDEFLYDDLGKKRRLDAEEIGLFEGRKNYSKKKTIPIDRNIHCSESQEVGEDEKKKEIVNRVRRVSASGDAEEGRFP